MFLSWKRYTKKMSKAREAEKAIAPFLEVLAKESWERDEKDVDLLYSFVRKIKFFMELEENMSRVSGNFSRQKPSIPHTGPDNSRDHHLVRFVTFTPRICARCSNSRSTTRTRSW